MTTLKQQLIRDTLREAGEAIATIDANTGLIAECEALADTLRAVGLDCAPLVTVSGNCYPRVFVCYQRHSHILDKIAAAGLIVSTDEPDEERAREPGVRRITLAGLTVPIEIFRIQPELAQAA